MHIDLKICHFLLLNVSIPEAGKSKNNWKTGFHGPSPCWGSTREQFLFYGVPAKIVKNAFFLGLYSQVSKMPIAIRCPKNPNFLHFFGHPVKQKMLSSTPLTGNELWIPVYP